MNGTFNVSEFRRLNLNVLLTFVALMRERSVTRAAERMFLGPPAVSMALRRLREVFGDPLFVRTAAGMEPTARALAVHPQVEAALAQLHAAVLQPPVFDPATLSRTFRFAAPDDLELALVPLLLERLGRAAPGVRLVVRPSDFRSVLGALDSGDAELALTAMPERMESWHRHRVLHAESFLCLYDRAQLGHCGTLTPAQYLATPHLLLSPRGDLRGPIDDELERRGLRRTVLVSVGHFPLMPFLLRKTASLVNMPATAARFYARAFDLEVSSVPVPSSRFDVALIWHSRHDADPALRWFAALVTQLVADLSRTTPAPRVRMQRRRE